MARCELFSTADAYQEIRPELGLAFFDEIGRVLTYIKEHPLAQEPQWGDVRRWRLKRFPYGLMDAVDGDVVYVLAVGHLRRSPKFWTRAAKRQAE